MPRITVYQFRFWNRATRSFEVSPDWATEKTILEIGAELIEISAAEVDAGRVSQPSGFLIRDYLPSTR